MWRRLNLEWLYRLVREPRRWRRQLALPLFVVLALRERAFVQQNGRMTRMKAMILAGGLSTRLYPLTRQVPKPLVPIDGEPNSAHVMRYLRSFGIEDVAINVHYLANAIAAKFGDGIRVRREARNTCTRRNSSAARAPSNRWNTISTRRSSSSAATI